MTTTHEQRARDAAIMLTLTGEQAEILAAYLPRVLSDLSVEIAGTDKRSYRDEIKAERRLLQEVMARLSQALATT